MKHSHESLQALNSQELEALSEALFASAIDRANPGRWQALSNTSQGAQQREELAIDHLLIVSHYDASVSWYASNGELLIVKGRNTFKNILIAAILAKQGLS